MIIPSNDANKDKIICFRHLANGEFAIGLFNPYDTEQTIMLPYFEIGLDPMCHYGFTVTDLFTGVDLGLHRDYLEARIPPTDCRMFRAKLTKL